MFDDASFDVVLQIDTLQHLRNAEVMLRETARVGRIGIVAFPNFAHWPNRLSVARGRMPVTRRLPYQWYDTPNIRVGTFKDFEVLAGKNNLRVLDAFGLQDGREELGRTIDITCHDEAGGLFENGSDLRRLICTCRATDLLDEGLDLAFRQGAHESVRRATIDEGDDGGDRLDAELTCDGRMVVNVHLDELDAAACLVHRLFDDRRQLATGTAPRRPEIDQDGLTARFLNDILAEGRCGRILDQIRLNWCRRG
eukprot:gene49822-66739_t